MVLGLGFLVERGRFFYRVFVLVMRGYREGVSVLLYFSGWAGGFWY